MTAERPRYREAYPKLDVPKAVASFRRGRNICAFRDEQSAF